VTVLETLKEKIKNYKPSIKKVINPYYYFFFKKKNCIFSLLKTAPFGTALFLSKRCSLDNCRLSIYAVVDHYRMEADPN
jgi:hypothetical protein